MMCLQSVIHSGLSPDVLQMYWCVMWFCFMEFVFVDIFVYRREYSHSYGFQHVLTLDNLTKAGLLRPKVCLSIRN